MLLKYPFICYVLLLVSPYSLSAQKIKLLNATRQVWNEGSTHRIGVYYKFNISFYKFSGTINVDTLWLNNDPYALNSINTAQFQDKGYLRFEIQVQKEFKTNIPIDKTTTQKLPFTYNGIALLSYTYNNKKHYFIINRILNTLPTTFSP